MKHVIYVIVLSLFAFGQLSGQATNQSHSSKKKILKENYIDVTSTLGIPLDAFGETTTSIPFGVTFNYLHKPSARSPILFGGGLTYLSAGSKRINQTLSADITVGNTIIDQLKIPLEFRIANSILNTHAMMRIQAHSTTVKPYADVLAGFNYFWTSTSLYDNSNQNYFQTQNDNNRVYSKNQQSSLAWSLGAGAGIMAKLGKATYLNLGATYMLGGKVSYYDRDQIRNWSIQLNPGATSSIVGEGTLDENDISVDAIPKKSISTMLMANAGVTFILGSTDK